MAGGDVYKWIGQAQSQLNVYMNSIALQFIGPGDPSTTDQQTLADDYMAMWRVAQNSLVNWTTWTLRQEWGSGMTIDTAKCRRLGGKVTAGTFTAPTAGSNGPTDMLPPQCAMVLTLLSGKVGRRSRGRVYSFGWSEADQANGTFAGALITAQIARCATFVNKYKTGGTSLAWTLGVWSERTATGCEPNPSGKGHVLVDTPHPELAFTPVTGFTVRNIVYTQRRRTLGVGR